MNNLTTMVGSWFIGPPLIFVWVVGIILSITHWQQAPKMARLSLMSFIGFLLVLAAQAGFNMFMLSSALQEDPLVMIVSTILYIAGIVFSLISAGLWSLLALFTQKEFMEKMPNLLR